MDVTNMELFARCAYGFEGVLADELRGLCLRRVRPLKGGVSMYGDRAAAYRACLWSRVATRVQLVVGRVPAATAEELYAGVRSLAWEQQLRRGATIALTAHGTNAQLRNTAFTALKAKDAVCDRLRELWGERPTVDAHHADAAIDVAVHEKKATVYFNLSGESLHRRGYRGDGVQTEAPLKETIAAGMLLAAGWPAIAVEGGVLVDPMCGSGTMAIEGALMAAGIAPGVLRERWGFEGWAGHDELEWAGVLADACAADVWSRGCVAVAGDIDARAVEVARAHARRAGVESMIQFYVDDAARLSRHLRGVKKRGVTRGLLVSNPPYGERLATQSELAAVHASLATAVGALPSGWRCALITPNASVDTALGWVPERTIACFNGPIEVCVRLYETSQERLVPEVVSCAGVRKRVPLGDERSLQFAARLRKVARERLRWARAEGVTCMRLYDCDVPEFRLAVDLYEGDSGSGAERFVLISEQGRPRSVDAEAAARRLSDASALAGVLLDVEASRVIARPWKGGATARKEESLALWVREGGLRFEVDLRGRPDTGLPLEQRGLRRMVRDLAAGGNFLNLFGVSAAASVCAAAGGARHTVTLEPFADRAQRVRETLAANGAEAGQHRVIEKDAPSWLVKAARTSHAYDVVLCAPSPWQQDVSREKVVRGVMGILAQAGTVVLAGSEASVAPWKAECEQAGLAARDVSERVHEPDFVRAHDPLCCYLLRA